MRVDHLDYVFDMALGMKKDFCNYFLELVISAFKEAVTSLQFFIASKLLQEYDLLFELNQFEITPFLV